MKYTIWFIIAIVLIAGGYLGYNQLFKSSNQEDDLNNTAIVSPNNKTKLVSIGMERFATVELPDNFAISDGFSTGNKKGFFRSETASQTDWTGSREETPTIYFQFYQKQSRDEIIAAYPYGVARILKSGKTTNGLDYVLVDFPDQPSETSRYLVDIGKHTTEDGSSDMVVEISVSPSLRDIIQQVVLSIKNL